MDSPFAQFEHPFRGLCEAWIRKIRYAETQKHDRFGQYAEEAMKFYDSAHTFMWDEEYARARNGYLGENSNVDLPTFRVQLNRVSEAVQLFGPALYHRNPNTMVTTRRFPEIAPESLGINPQDPIQLQQYQLVQMGEAAEHAVKATHGRIYEAYSNWLQQEGDKKKESRDTITEAIIKGMGLLWTDMYTAASGVSMPRTRHVSVDDLQIDPDAEYWYDVTWAARKCIHPVYKVERKYGLPAGSLKGHLESLNMQGEVYAQASRLGKRKRKKNNTHDLLEYWEVYSKTGFGDKLRDSPKNLRGKFEVFGDYCYLAVARNIPFPLNLPSWVNDPEEAFQRVQWPIPYWQDEIAGGGGWPFTRIYFWGKPKEVWPISTIKPVIGLMRFVNWCMSFLADKVAASSSTIVGVLKAAGEDIRKQLADQSGPYKVLEIAEVFNKSIKEMIAFVDAPTFSIDIWKMVSEAMVLIDKGTGLTEMIYGMTGPQVRSATEAGIRDANVSIRPDEMANQVEDALSEVAMKEIEAARWMLSGDDVRGAVGNMAAHVWDTQILQTDVDDVVKSYRYRIEAGSAKKPNRNTQMRNLVDIGPVITPMLQMFAQIGQTGPWNAYVKQLGNAMQFDVSEFLVPEFQPPQPEQEGREDEMEDLQFKEAEHEQTLRHNEERFKMEMKQEKQKARVTNGRG